MSKKIVFDIETNTDLGNVDKQINDIIGSTKTLRQQYAELRDAAAEATDPKDFDRLAKAAGQLKDRIDDTNRSVRAFASDTRRLDVVVGSVQGIAGAFAATQGAIALLAGENENLNKVLVKVQGSLAVLNGIQQVANTLNKNSAVGLALYRAQQTLLNSSIFAGAGALTAFRAALIATGVGALVAGLGLLIANFDELTQAMGLSKSELEKFNEEQKKLADELELRLKKIVIDTGEEFTAFREEIELTTDPVKKLEKLIKKFPEFSALDSDDLDEVNKKLKDRETIQVNLSKEAEIQRNEAGRTLQITELNIERDEALIQGNKEKSKLLASQIESLQRQNATGREQLTILRTQRISIQDRIADEIKGIADVSKANEDAERRRLEGIRLREQAARIDEQNRIALIENRIQRELALITERYNRERTEARKVGADIALINQREERERANFIQSQQKALGEVILKAFRGVNEDLKKLSLSTYEEDLKEFNRVQEEKRKTLIEELNVLELSLDLTEAQGDVSIQKQQEENKLLKERIRLQLESLKVIQKREQELLLLNSVTDGLSFIISLEEKIRDINIIGGDEAIKKTKEEVKFRESLSDLKLTLAEKEAEKRLLEEAKIVEAISVAGDKETFLKLKNKEIEVEALTEKQKRYADELEELDNQIFESSEDRVNAELALEQKFIDEGLKFRREYFLALNKLKQESVKSEIRVNEGFVALESSVRDVQLENEKRFLLDKQELLQGDFKTEQKRQEAISKLESEYALRSLRVQIKLKEDKLKVLEEEKKVNPNINPKLLSEIQNEILELQNNAYGLQRKLATQNVADLSNIIRSVTQEISFQTDAILSGIAGIYSTAQSENQKLLQQGKITAEENERRQKELFEQQKKIEISRTVISTISSAQGAFQSQFVPVPDPSSPIRGGIFAAAALAAGYARVKAIQNQTFSGSATSAPQPVNAGSFLRDPGTSQVIEPQRDPNIPPSLRVFVTENDITETQRRVRVIQNGSRTTF